MFLLEWREFPSAPRLARKETWWQLASLFCWNRTRPWHASELISFLVGLRTYQHPGTFVYTECWIFTDAHPFPFLCHFFPVILQFQLKTWLYSNDVRTAAIIFRQQLATFCSFCFVKDLQNTVIVIRSVVKGIQRNQVHRHPINIWITLHPSFHHWKRRYNVLPILPVIVRGIPHTGHRGKVGYEVCCT